MHAVRLDAAAIGSVSRATGSAEESCGFLLRSLGRSQIIHILNKTEIFIYRILLGMSAAPSGIDGVYVSRKAAVCVPKRSQGLAFVQKRYFLHKNVNKTPFL